MEQLVRHLNIFFSLAFLFAIVEIPCVFSAELKSETLNVSTRQDKFLGSVAPTIRSWRTFEEWSKCLGGANIANIFSSDSKVKTAKCEPLVDSAHKLTFAETFETIARQTQSTVHYDANAQQWVFEKPQMPLPYSISIADGWKAEDRGYYVAYIPAIAPVGMDIYMNGRFKGLNEQQLVDIRDEQALVFADRMHNGVTIADMTPTTVDGADALYYKTKSPVKGRQWRQWTFVKNDQSFIIVSTVADENEAKLIPEVEKMVHSFHVVNPAVSFPGL